MESSERSISDNNAARRTGASAQSLERAIDWLTSFGHLCAIIVVIGVVLEYRKAFVGLWNHFTLTELRAFVRETLGGILVAIGVAGELWFGFLADRKDNKLRSINAERIAELNLSAERERLARVKLEAHLAPRSMSNEQQDKLIAEVRSMPPQHMDVIVIGSTPEILNFERMVTEPIAHAGWKVKVSHATGTGIIVRGIAICFVDGASDEQTQAANRLIVILKSIGVFAESMSRFPVGNLPCPLTGAWDRNNVAPIRMFIGAKP